MTPLEIDQWLTRESLAENMIAPDFLRSMIPIAYERGRQQGVMEAVDICERYGWGVDGPASQCAAAIRAHAAKESTQ